MSPSDRPGPRYEHAPPAPDVAREIFGPMLPAAQAYAELLADAGVQRGLLGPGEAGRLWERHLLNCAVVAELVPASGRLIDLGSGAGLPGIVLAMLLPGVHVTLLEPMARRTVFLTECVRELGLANVEVIRGRAEDLAGEIDGDVVTARAVAALDRLAVLASGVSRPGGLVLAIKGASAADELDRAWPVLRRLGAVNVELIAAGAGRISQPATVVRWRTRAAGAAGISSRQAGTRPSARRSPVAKRSATGRQRPG
jgi:16S rRNA (guanine527-N7)-methyltransferase